MRPLHIHEALNGAWEHFTRRGWYLVGLSAAVLLIAVAVIGEAIATALYSIVVGGYIAILLKHARREEFVFDDVFIVDKRWVYFAFGAVIKGVLITLGLFLFVVPGIYLAVRWMFSELYIIDKGMRPLEALRASSELTQGYRWKLFWYLLIVTFMALLGLLAFGVGLFVAVPIINLANILVFWKLQELQYLNSQG